MISWRLEKPGVHMLTGAYVLNALDGSERSIMERHLRMCASCAGEIVELAAAVSALSAMVVAAPPQQLRGQVLAAIRQTPQLPPACQPRRAITMPRVESWWGGLAVATAGVVFLVFSAFMVLGHRDNTDSFPGGSADSVAEVLRSKDAVTHSALATNGAVLTVFTSPRHNAGVAVMSNMALPPAGHAYQLWLMGPNEVRSAAIVSLGATTQLISHVDGATRLGLTLELAGGSGQPSTAPLLVVSLE